MGLILNLLRDTKNNYSEEASSLIRECKFLANQINACYDIDEFCDMFCQIIKSTNRLIFLNERQHIGMTPPPRKEKEKIIADMPEIINSFIDRGIKHLWLSEPAISRQEATLDFIDEISSHKRFSKELNRDNLEYIRLLADQAKHELDVYAQEQEKKRQRLKKEKDDEAFSKFCLAIAEDEENWRREQRGLSPVEYELEKVDSMEGHAFECWCADLLRKNGFTNVEVTPGSNDQGVDVLAQKDGIKYAIQCKCYASDLGNTPIQEVHAGKAFYNCQVGVVMTNRHFTKGAQELADKTGTLLWDRDRLAQLLQNEQ